MNQPQQGRSQVFIGGGGGGGSWGNIKFINQPINTFLQNF